MSSFCNNSDMRRILVEAVLLTALAFAVGFSINYSLVMNAFSGKVLSDHKKDDPLAYMRGQANNIYPEPIEMNEVTELLAEGALAVDARNITDYKSGHLVGAISLPLADFDSRIIEFHKQVDKGRNLIVYCNGFDCPDSFELGLLLCQEGYRQVLVYEGGFPEWRDAGQPIEVQP